ncbi:MAG: type II toxin-antitoxin system RelE/ParE family toxin [Planctomycetia bacterium]|nr:type II toxin-antitoxin system RelE/ParE family toxin [Planctomycetia bacterium]
MPETKVYFYRENDTVPVYDWLRELSEKDRKALANCVAKIRLLADEGHELRRPHADYLQDGIYELRTKRGRVNYRILYFFHGQNVALLVHGLTKEKNVPRGDMDKARTRKQRYEKEPAKHRAEIELAEKL